MTATVRTKELGSNITKTTSQTFTVANNGGVYYIASGSGAKANAAIEAAMIGAAKDRSNGPSMQATPMKVGERPANGMMCSKAGSRCEDEQYLYDPNEPSWLAKTAGDVIGAFRSPDKDGYRTNPFTGQHVPNPEETRTNTLGNLLSFAFAPEFTPLRASSPLRMAGQPRETLFHYTSEKGFKGIMDSEELLPSLRQANPKDARYGNGQYLSDIRPGILTSSQLSQRFVGIPFLKNKFAYYVEINTRGLNVVKGRDGVFVIPGDKSLNLSGRIVSFGRNGL
jgi:hypothetical protein